MYNCQARSRSWVIIAAIIVAACLLSACNLSDGGLRIAFWQPTPTATVTATATYTPTASVTPTASATATATSTATLTPTATHTPTSTPTATATSSPTPTVEPLKMSLAVDPPSVQQGHTLAIRIQANHPISLTGFLDGRLLRFFETGEGGWTVVGFGPYVAAQPYLLQVAGIDRFGQQARVSTTIQVSPVSFGTDYLTISPSLQPLLDPEVRRKEAERLQQVFTGFSPTPLWEGIFTLPVPSVVTSSYGRGRSYNNQPVSSFHGGVDLRGSLGTPVVAANAGRVVLAERMQVHGNLIVLDHGLGVHTAYAHLSEINVTVGQMVQKGEVIGKVGSTGLVTGPHLHWEVRIANVPVNPLEWTERSIP